MEAALGMVAPGIVIPSESVAGRPQRVLPQSAQLPVARRGLNILFSSGLKMFTEVPEVAPDLRDLPAFTFSDGTTLEYKDGVDLIRADGGPLFEFEEINGVEVRILKPGKQKMPNGSTVPLDARATFMVGSIEYQLVSEDGDLSLVLEAATDILDSPR